MSVELPTDPVRGDGVTLRPDAVDRLAADAADGTPLGHLELRRLAAGVVGVGWLPRGDTGLLTVVLSTVTDWLLAHGAHRVELLAGVADLDLQRAALAAGLGREGVRRGAGDGPRDLVAFARLSGDRPGPVARRLPDLPDGALSDGVVTLRPLTAVDASDTYRLRVTPDVVDTWVPPVAPSEREVRARCEQAPAAWLAGDLAELTVRDAGTDAYAGEISLHYQAPSLRLAMLGYSLLPEHRGKGYATRAVSLLSRWVFEHTDVERLIAGTWVANAGSQRVLERAGFRREGVQRGLLPAADGSRRDNIEFALLRQDDTSS